MKPIHLRGVGLWAPGFPDAVAWREGRPDPAVDRPPCALVNARLGRGSSRFAGMLGEVVEQAAKQGGVDVRSVPTVYGSSLGEIETMVTLLRMLYEEEGKLSPNRFKNSVHNAASGLVSIGTGNTGFSTAIAGGDRSFEVSLLEAWAWLDQRGGDVVLAVADDAPPEPLDQLDQHGALAIGLCLSAAPAARPGQVTLSNLRPLREAPPSSVPADLTRNCASAGLALLDAFLDARLSGAGGAATRTVSISLPGRVGMGLDVQVASPPAGV